MNAKAPPQDRAVSSMRAMIEARHGAGIEDANDWLARGWNPFIPQLQGGSSITAANLMGLNYYWVEWLWANKAKLAPLFAQAYPPGANGLSEARNLLARAASRSDGSSHDFLTLLIELGADPNARSSQLSDSLFNNATRSGAEALAAVGSISENPPNRPSIWEAWAERVMYGYLNFADLDWLEERCSPRFASPCSHVGRLALNFGQASMLERMASLGAGPACFGLDAPGQLAKDLRALALAGDAYKSFSALIGICGQDAVLDAFLDSDHAAGHPLSALSFCLLNGRSRCLGVMERAGLLSRSACAPIELAKSNALLWASGAPEGYRLQVGSVASAGAVWCMSRIPASQVEEASAVFALYAKANPMAAAPSALTCASKGFLPTSGPRSLHELYLNGAAWRENDSLGSFSEFVARCEAKMLRKNSAKKAAPPKSRMRL